MKRRLSLISPEQHAGHQLSRQRQGLGNNDALPGPTAQQLGDDNQQFNASNLTYNAARRVEPKIPIAESARFNSRSNAAKSSSSASYLEQDQAECLKDTRVDLLRQIYTWADGDDERGLFWLTGFAGTGKSTVARTVARTYSEKKRLAASFFFGRGLADRGNSNSFVTAIAYQLAVNIPDVKDSIFEAIDRDRAVMEQTVSDQWFSLVLQPLAGLREMGQFVLVIDALDECDGEQPDIIEALMQLQSLGYKHLRVFLTSRPEPDIRFCFLQQSKNSHKDFILHDIEQETVDSDIRLFLNQKFSQAARRFFKPRGWPGNDTIQLLTRRAGQLFIWAATACKYVLKDPLLVESRLQMLLKQSASTKGPEEKLNEMYTFVLNSAFSDAYSDDEVATVRTEIERVLGCILALFKPLSSSALGTLLAYEHESRVEALLDKFHAVLDLRKGKPIGLHHPSLRDFLLNQRRSRLLDFSIDEATSHQQLFRQSLQLMRRKLQRNICRFESPDIRYTAAVHRRVKQYVSPGLQYACLHWAQHLDATSCKLEDLVEAYNFLKVHLLQWLEVMAWLDSIDTVARMLAVMIRCTWRTMHTELQSLSNDAMIFVRTHFTLISKMPLQIYLGALVFTSQHSAVKQCFHHIISSWVVRPPRYIIQSEEQVNCSFLRGHTNKVQSVAISSDGEFIASVDVMNLVLVWNDDGMIMDEHQVEVPIEVLTFSPDSNFLVMAWKQTAILTSRDEYYRSASRLGSWQKAHSCDRERITLDETTMDVVFSHNSSRLALLSHRGDVRVVSTKNPDIEISAMRPAPSDDTSVCAVSFGQNTEMLACKDPHGMVVVIHGDHRGRQQLQSCTSQCRGLYFVQSGTRLVVQSPSQQVQIIDLERDICTTIIDPVYWFTMRVVLCQYEWLELPHSDALMDQYYQYKNLLTSSCWHTFWADTRMPHVAASRKKFAIRHHDRTIQVWHLTAKHHSDAPREDVVAISHTANSYVLSCEGQETMLKRVHKGSGLATTVLCARHEPDTNILFSLDGYTVAYLTHGNVTMWSCREVCSPAAVGDEWCYNFHDQPITGSRMMLSCRGQYLAYRNTNATVNLRNTNSGRILPAFWLLEAGSITATSFSDDDSMLLVGSKAGSGISSIHVWDIHADKVVDEIDLDTEHSISALATSHENGLFAVTTYSDAQELFTTVEYDDLWILSPDLEQLCLVAIPRTPPDEHRICFCMEGRIVQTNRGWWQVMNDSGRLITNNQPRLSLYLERISEQTWLVLDGRRFMMLPEAYCNVKQICGSTITIQRSDGLVFQMELSLPALRRQRDREWMPS